MIELTLLSRGQQRRPGSRRMKKDNPKTDLTPMVDLGFLLIAFFVITTELSKPVITNLNMPHDGPPVKLKGSNALTVLLDNANMIYYYQGDWKEALAKGEVYKTNFAFKGGLGDIIREKQLFLDRQAKINGDEGRKGLMLLIKASRETNYESVVDVLDEILINDVKKYALVKPEIAEINYLGQQKQ
jgi:biopolymer transport protein ExbD